MSKAQEQEVELPEMEEDTVSISPNLSNAPDPAANTLPRCGSVAEMSKTSSRYRHSQRILVSKSGRSLTAQV
jgi:hypothetical protein